MTGRLVVLSGTGTGIGKTHLGEALLLAWRAEGRRAVGLKPIESGVAPDAETDAGRLAAASTFHVEHSGVALPDPVSPHLAARRAGVVIELGELASGIRAAREEADLVLVELPGGLFSPVSPEALNADFAALLAPDVLLLAAPDRLGVLHDVIATARAAASRALQIHGIVLIAPATPDASTGTNAAELPSYVQVPVLATVPRASAPALRRSLSALLSWLG